jgi:hypothetical protein
MVLMGVGDQDRGHFPIVDTRQDLLLMNPVERPGVDDHNPAVSVIEDPRVGPGSGERAGVVGKQ